MNDAIPRSKLQLISALASSTDKHKIAEQLAPFYNADNLVIFLKDREIGIFLPVAGFPLNLKNGAAWQAFLNKCVSDGRAQSYLEFSETNGPIPVLATRGDADSILVLVGAQSAISDDDELLALLPLLTWAFDKEKLALTSVANVALAREREMVASLLAESLDKARAKLASALVDAQRAEEALRLADQRKDEFLAILAHELRNPLAPIGNGIELLKHAEKSPQMLPKIRKIMSNQLRQMTRLIDDLMDVSRITRGKISLRIETVLLKQIIDSAIEGAQPFIDQQNHELILHMPNEPIVLNADAARLSQVFSNLLNNAAKYTDPGGVITVAVQSNQDEVMVSISDTGVGLNADEADNIFDMFVQVERAIDDARGGLGIGLTLVKNLVELHEGRVAAKSQGRGTGSEFIVTLPKAKAGEPQTRNPATVLRPADQSKPLEILVVDDNEASARTMGMLVEMLGHKAYVAFRGYEALDQAIAHQPQIVLLDIGLPDISGYDLCQKLHTALTSKETIIVAQTGRGQDSDRRKAKEAGFSHFLVKPVDIDSLNQIIELAKA